MCWGNVFIFILLCTQYVTANGSTGRNASKDLKHEVLLYFTEVFEILK